MVCYVAGGDAYQLHPRQPQGPMSLLKVLVEKLDAYGRIEGGIPLGEGVRLAGEGITPIVQCPVESFDLHSAS